MLKRILLAAWLALAGAIPALATSILPLDLGQIVDQSTTAFQGTVVENRSGRDPQSGLPATYTTFTVQDVLKGDVPATYTIKQVGGEAPGESLKFKAFGVPHFAVGESYVVFMAGVSSAGFSSPIGLSQGRFTIESGNAGPEVTNGRDFREMTGTVADMQLPEAAKAKSDAPMHRLGLDDFKQMVRTHVRGRQ